MKRETRDTITGALLGIVLAVLVAALVHWTSRGASAERVDTQFLPLGRR